jgi:hypothetical protein
MEYVDVSDGACSAIHSGQQCSQEYTWVVMQSNQSYSKQHTPYGQPHSFGDVLGNYMRCTPGLGPVSQHMTEMVGVGICLQGANSVARFQSVSVDIMQPTSELVHTCEVQASLPMCMCMRITVMMVMALNITLCFMPNRLELWQSTQMGRCYVSSPQTTISIRS